LVLTLYNWGFFLAGGIANVLMLRSPAWVTIFDLTCVYVPMAYFGAKLAPVKH
jgi:hypothetical protein